MSYQYLVRFSQCNLQKISKYFGPISTKFQQRHIHTSPVTTVKLKMAYQIAKTENAVKIFETAVAAVLPHEMITQHVLFDSEENILKIEDKEYEVNKNIYVVGFGKAVCGMARAIDDILGDEIQAGIISVPVGCVEALETAGKSDMVLQENSKIKMMKGGRNNLPDNDSYQAANSIQKLAGSLTPKDVLLVLISGGGSALLPSPSFPISLEDEMTVIKLLCREAATIQQLNMVRKKIEVLKGGGLAFIAYPSKVVSLILSDVIGDPLDIIASGPTVPDSSTPKQCLDLLKNLELLDQIPVSVLEHLNTMSDVSSDDKMDLGSHDWEHVQNVIVGSNRKAAIAASKEADTLGYLPHILSTTLDGEAKEIGHLFVNLAEFICMSYLSKRSDGRNKALTDLEFEIIRKGVTKSDLNSLVRSVEKCRSIGQGLCVIAGGETTVKINGTGKGGRNQEMVLASAIDFNEIYLKQHVGQFDIKFLSAGTDGQDGPTDAAGAVISPGFAKLAEEKGIDLQEYLDNNDSYTLFSQFNSEQVLVETGLTGTNVMDLQLLLVKFKK